MTGRIQSPPTEGTASKIPQFVSLRVCETCGRTDRYTSLSAEGQHYNGGKRCNGRPIKVTYRLEGVRS